MVWLISHTYVFQTKMVVKCKGFVIQRNFFFFFSTLALFEELDWKENGVLVNSRCLSIPAFECASFFFPKLLSVEKKKGLKASVVSVFCVIYPFQRLRLLILGLTIGKKNR
eukprot:UN10089